MAFEDGPLVNSIHRAVVAAAFAHAALTSLADAQRPSVPPSRPLQLVYSIGQPKIWKPYVDALGTWTTTGAQTGGANFVVGVERAIMSPVLGVLSASAEGYGMAGGAFAGGGARAFAGVPLMALKTGLDWNLGTGRTGRIDWVLSYQSAIRRGGLFGGGTMLRLDWLPTRHQMIGVGIEVPILQPTAGRTRPRRTSVTLPGRTPIARSPALSPAAEAALATVGEAATLLRAYTSLHSNEDVKLLRLPPPYAEGQSLAGRGYTTVSLAYFDALGRTFRAVSGDSVLGGRIARRARDGLLEDVVIPYDALFGQAKDDADDIRAFTSVAARHFARWLRDSSDAPAARRNEIVGAHTRWLGIVEAVHRALIAQWKDSRLIWLPLQLALSPDQYDERDEVDALIVRAIGRPFTDGNTLAYMSSTEVPLEIARSIYAARDYHVLWVHDFTGRLPSGRIDNIGYEMVADVYFPALTAAVAHYDSLGSIPLFMIVIDQYYYEQNKGRLWMTILEDPLHASMKLGGSENAQREAHLRERQRELRAAVAASRRLQREAAQSRRAGRWLRRAVKVHVNVMQPADFSFRSGHIVSTLPFTPDNLMRDHRKIVIFDANEADPNRGAALLMGIGIGEHFGSASWEDRAYRLHGPAVLEMRAAIRRQLRRNGFREEQIPLPLREVRDTDRTPRNATRDDHVGRAILVHNEVGFGPKRSSVIRALLYNLSPPGSTVVVPDPFWMSPEWGAMLSATAMRGAKVHVIAPSEANTPGTQEPVLVLTRDMMLRFIMLRRELAGRLQQSGGELRVGIFSGVAELDDVAGLRRELREGLEQAPWIRELIPFDERQLTVIGRAAAIAAREPDARQLARDEKPRRPQLHQKTQLIARPGAIAMLVQQSGWEDVLANALERQARESARLVRQLGSTTPDVDRSATRLTDSLLADFERTVPDSARRQASLYFTLGSHNEDTRGLALDGEASLVTSGFQGITGLIDLYFVMTRSSWVTTESELDRYLPPRRGIVPRLTRFLREVF